MENKYCEYVEYLPIGSVVIIRGNVRKMMIIARGAMCKINGTLNCFDYAGVLYPDGLVSDKLIYFNHKDIYRVVFEGFSDEDEKIMKDNINEWIKNSGVLKGNPYDINVKNMAKDFSH